MTLLHKRLCDAPLSLALLNGLWMVLVFLNPMKLAKEVLVVMASDLVTLSCVCCR